MQTKTCNGCGSIKIIDQFYPVYYKSGKIGQAYQCKECQKLRKYAYLQNDNNYNKRKQKDKETRDKLRLKILNYYSNCKMECACCKEKRIQFLSLDHIYGEGRKERLAFGNRLWTRLIRNNFPEGYRVLCHNCNQSYGLYGFCPHEKERQEIESLFAMY